jgi:TolB-like protein/Flp pilus assembly protein TadD
LSLFNELKRRNVIRVAIAYSLTAWVLLQIADVVLNNIEAPDWLFRAILLLVALGFPLALILAWAFELTPEGIKKEKDVDRSTSVTATTGRKLEFVIIGILVVGIVFLLVEKFSQPPESPTLGATELSIAVLPFVNMSSDPEQEFFSDGITEEILNALAAVRQLKVAGRTSSFAFKGQNDDLRRIGDTLGVGYILEGSVRRSGTKVRISAQLVQVNDGFHVWVDTYDRELTDIFAIQDEIAAAIIGQLKAALLVDEQQAMTSLRTTPEVYERYLLARQRMYDRSQAALEDALRLLDESIDRDPEYAPAYAQRGIVAMLLADDSYGTIPEDEALQQGKRYLDLALEIDPESAEALAGLGLYYVNGVGNTDKAIDALTKSLSINPNQPDASVWLANALSTSGDIAGQLKVLEELTERDPLFRPAFINSVFAFNAHGMPVEALALIERVRSFDPNDPALLQAEAGHLFFRGDLVEGFRLAEKALALAPNAEMANLVFNGGLQQTQQLEQLVKSESVPFVVDTLDALGHRDEAFERAFAFASRGMIRYLFVLYNRVDRSDELVAYLEERWPSLDAFAADYAPDEFGYGVMLSVVLAYSRTGNEERFAEALHRYERGIAQVKAQGADNRFMDFESALHFAVAGNQQKAFEILESLADKGMFAILPLGESVPEFASIKSEPRFVAIENRMLELVNSQRAELGLGPVNPAKDFWQYNK